jgi:hypothetical protein
LNLAASHSGDSVQADTVIHDPIVVSNDVIVDHRRISVNAPGVVAGRIVVVRMAIVKSIQGNKRVTVVS